MDRNLAQRIGFAAAAIPFALGIAWYGGWALVAFLVLVTVLGTRELYRLFERGGGTTLEIPGLIGAALLPPAVYLALGDSNAGVARMWPYLAALWLIAVLTVGLWRRTPGDQPIEAIATTVFGVAYAAALPSFLIDLRHGSHGTRSWAGAWLVFFPLVVTWVCDTAAMFAGRAIGGPKLAPTVSPGKTQVGGIAGVIGGLLMAPLFHAVIFPWVGVETPLAALVIIAGTLSIIGQVGDLAESLFKRQAGVKDSSQLIPGHGGVLDRLDSLYFVIPTAAALYRALGIQ
jgi:phosphatidate cytidylyltransferase